NFAASSKPPTRPRGFFLPHSASFSGARVPIITAWSCLRKPAARVFPTSPDPTIPTFMFHGFSFNGFRRPTCNLYLTTVSVCFYCSPSCKLENRIERKRAAQRCNVSEWDCPEVDHGLGCSG